MNDMQPDTKTSQPILSLLRRVLLLFLPIALVIGAGAFFYHQAEVRRLHEERAKQEHETVRVGIVSINRTLEFVSRDMLDMVKRTAFREMLDNPTPLNIRRTAENWISFSQAKQYYDKIRWIDEAGMERLRIDYDTPKPYMVPPEHLQYRGGRYFFADTNRLNEGEIYVSPLDLNVEGSEIEVPYTPTIRFGMPVFDNKGVKRGILLLNFFANDMLNRFSLLTTVSGGSAPWLLNQDGYWLKGEKPEDEFGFMFGRDDLTMATRYPAVWQKVASANDGQFETADGLWTFDTVFPLQEGHKTSTGSSEIFAPSRSEVERSAYAWKAVSLLPHEQYNAGLREFEAKLWGVVLVLLALFFAGIWRLVRAQMAEEAVRLNLEQLVGERTKDLKKANETLVESEARLRSLFATIPDMIWMKDINGIYLACNPAFEHYIGVKEKELIGKTDYDYVPAKAADFFHSRDIATIEGGEPKTVEDWLTFADDGHRALFEIVKVPVKTADGQMVGILGIARDITKRKQAEEELQLAALVFQSSSQAIIVTDASNKIVAVNPSFERITGYKAEEVLGKNPRIVSSGRQEPAFYKAMWNAINTTGHWQGELWNRRKNGEVFAAWLTINTIYNPDGSVRNYVELSSDFTKKKEAEDLIWRQANFDFLTGLPNRHMFLDRLRQEVRQAQRSGMPLALMFLDLDHFKDVNDTLGHDMGDLMLQETSRRIISCVRDMDTVSRLGGDEFTVIVTELGDPGSVERVAQEILRRLAEPFKLGQEVAYITASIGITVFPDDGTEVDDLLKNADQAMYAAKQQGRNRSSYFTPSMQKAAQARMRLINDLRLALEGNQFEVLYQPIVELSSGAIHKAEALIRWHHPTRGLINPTEFIPIAEETGLILSIGDWSFRQAAKQVKRWRELHYPQFQISFNMSPVQFHSEQGSRSDWFQEMHGMSLPGQSLVVEITEGLLLLSSTGVIKQLAEFGNEGMQVALDDFGTGYSSLSYLKRFNIDYLKIDQSFVHNMATEPRDMALCEAIIVMAHKLGMKVIAEGVQTEEQKALLTAAGCDYGQGYLFSQPIPAHEFDELLAKNEKLLLKNENDKEEDKKEPGAG